MHKRIAEGVLPALPVIVGSGWLNIDMRQHDGSYQTDHDYDHLIAKHPNWNREEVVATVKQLISQYPEFNLSFQHQSSDNLAPVALDVNKIGLYFFAQNSEARREVQRIFAESFPGVLSLVCGEINHNAVAGRTKKFCLDVTAMDKLGALLYLQKLLGISRGIAGGDSGNDSRFVTLSPDVLGVVVGGCKEELKEAVDEMAENSSFDRRENSGVLRRLVGNKRVFVENSTRRGPQSLLRAAALQARFYRRHAASMTEELYFDDLSKALHLLPNS